MASDVSFWQRLPLGPKFRTSAIALPILLILLYLGGWPLFVVATAAMVVGLHEFYSGVLRKNIVPVSLAGWVCSTGIMAATQFVSKDPAWRSGIITTCIAGSVLLAFIAQFWRPPNTSVIANTGATVFGVVWIGLLFSFFLRLRTVELSVVPGIPHGGFRDRTGALILVIAAVWLQDTAAQLTGKLMGTRKPWPQISPNKTWEGCIGGLVAAVAVTVALGSSFGLEPVHMVFLGLVLSVFGQLGDFCKSLIKRELGVKDFGNIIPGHGGVLDRFDSLLFTMPIAYLYFRLFLPWQ